MPTAAPEPAWPRHVLAFLVLGVCGLLLLHTFVLEVFLVPSGSMAPALLGQHRLCTCPRCGQTFPVGRHPSDRPACYRNVACPNCGQHPSAVTEAPEVGGDRLLVNKAAFVVRTPRRWEIVVLRLFGSFFIKRLIGLPGEELLLRDGDVYVDGRLVRKTFAEARAMRVPVFAQAHVPGPAGWAASWECEPAASMTGRVLELDGRATPCTLTYRHYLLDERKAEPLGDEYVYNRGAHAGVEDVHDFSFEADVEIQAGQGTLVLRLYDGQDWVEVEVPVGILASRERERPECSGRSRSRLATTFRPGRHYHVDMALVDRRLTLAVDGVPCLSADLPEPGVRHGVVTPVQLRAEGVAVVIHNFRLFRDIHYSQRGAHAVRGRPVRLGPGQYFVLGDNSPDSEDSRFWADQGRVAACQLVGTPFRVR